MLTKSSIKIFISYRREDTEASAGRLFDTLSSKFNANNLFKDVDSIPLGFDFQEVIEEKIGECDIVLAIIGKRFVKAKDKNGDIRIFSPDDFVHMELDTALRARKIVIPVMVDHSEIPRITELPDNLQKIRFLAGIKLRHDSWNRDTEKLHKEILKIIDILNSRRKKAEKQIVLEPKTVAEPKPEASIRNKTIKKKKETAIKVYPTKVFNINKGLLKRIKLGIVIVTILMTSYFTWKQIIQHKEKSLSSKEFQEVDPELIDQSDLPIKSDSIDENENEVGLVKLKDKTETSREKSQSTEENSVKKNEKQKETNDAMKSHNETPKEINDSPYDISWRDKLHGSFVDSRDMRKYEVVKINNQIWMTENLAATQLVSGESIAHTPDNGNWLNLESPGYCWYENNQAKYIKEYGALYNWYVVETGEICPEGWQVPRDSDWQTLQNSLERNGGMQKSFNWTYGGNRFGALGYNGLDFVGCWWSKDQKGNSASEWYTKNGRQFQKTIEYKPTGVSIRCIKAI